MSGVRPEWRGTEQHRDAGDLSRYLIHLTRSEEDLLSILRSGRIEARRPFGAGRGFPTVQRLHHSVCLTEIPLDELRRMTSKRPWGIAFDKERLRTKFGAQPVWYVRDPSPELEAINQAMGDAAADPAAPIWKLTPFIEQVRSLRGSAPNDWRAEREWRVRGHLDFNLDDVALLLLDDSGKTDFLDEISIGLPYISLDEDTPRWWGGFTSSWDEEMNAMITRFREQFVPVENSGAIWDQEDDRWFSPVEILSEQEAMDEAFGELSPEVARAFEALLSNAEGWCRTYDLDHAGE